MTRFFIFIVALMFLIGCRHKETVTDQKVDLKFSALPTTVRATKDNPTTKEKVELGRLLFFDPILSGHKDVSCATCHHPEYGFAESLEISIGVNGQGLGEKRGFKSGGVIPFTKRNAHTILNTAFNGIDPHGDYSPEEAQMFWDLRAQSLEKQSLEPIKSFEEMRGHAYEKDSAMDQVVKRLAEIGEYKTLFTKSFPESEDEPISEVNIGKAIAAYERTLIATNSRFDKYMRGDSTSLSSFEKEGMSLFVKSGCASCHNGPMFSDFKTHALGIVDNEKLGFEDKGINDTYAFRTPTLRNLRFTAPYMHNGKLKTLQEVLEFYEDLTGEKISKNSHIRNDQLDPLLKDLRVEFKNIRLIIEFLNSLNDSDYDKTIPERVPSGLKVGGDI
jgi:cytochrome c peroxidase